MKRDIFRFIAFSIILTVIIALTGYASGFIVITPEVSKSRAESRKLQKIEPNDVESMKIIFWNPEIERVEHALQQGKPLDKDTIAGLITLLKKANPIGFAFTTGYMVLRDFDYILQVKLKNGDSIEVPYVTSFNIPFGDLKSDELKAALYSLTDPMRGNIILFNAGKVSEVIGFFSPKGPPDGGPIPRDPIYVSSSHLNKEGQIILDLRIIKNDKEIIHDIRPVGYGSVLSYDNEGQGYLILDIFSPYSKRG
jgi:hypothetical protein